MHPDAIIRARSRTTDEGGRRRDVVIAGAPYGCVVLVDAEGFDGRFFVADRTLRLGGTYDLPVKFLCPALALPKLSFGKSVSLWEGKFVATGEVVWLA